MDTLIGTRSSDDEEHEEGKGNYFGTMSPLMLDVLLHMLVDNPANPLPDVCI